MFKSSTITPPFPQSLAMKCVVLACLMALAMLTSSMPVFATTWTGAISSVWDIGTTANWTGGTGSVYTDGDNVVFDNSGANKSINVAVPVSPGTITFNNTAGNAYSFTGSTIGGVGGTTITSNGTVNFNPAGAGAHSFGGGPISLNNAGSIFTFNPGTSGASLTNNFNINAAVTWDKSGNNGIRTGTATVNSNFTLRSDGASGGVMDANMLLTANRTISGSRFGSAFPRISGNVSSSGGPHNITLSTNGDNTDWHLDVTSPTGWNVKDIIHDAAGAQRATLLFLVGNESTFFSTMDANGGQLRLLRGGTKVGSDNTINLTFDMVVNAPHRGFIDNNLVNISGGGNLYGTGTLASKAGIGNDLNVIYQSNMNVNVNSGGTIAPGDPQALSTIGKLTVDGNVVFNGGTLAIEINGVNTAGTDYDQLVVSDIPAGGGNFGKVSGVETANLVLDFDPSITFDDLSGKTLTILTSASLLSSEFATVSDNFNPGIGVFSYDVLFQGNQILVTNFQFTLPEPNSMLLMLGMLGCGMMRRRTRRVRQSHNI